MSKYFRMYMINKVLLHGKLFTYPIHYWTVSSASFRYLSRQRQHKQVVPAKPENVSPYYVHFHKLFTTKFKCENRKHMNVLILCVGVDQWEKIQITN